MGNCLSSSNATAPVEMRGADMKDANGLHQHTKSKAMEGLRSSHTRHGHNNASDKGDRNAPANNPCSAEEQDYRDAIKVVTLDMLERISKVVVARKPDFVQMAVKISANTHKRLNFFQILCTNPFEKFIVDTLTLPRPYLASSPSGEANGDEQLNKFIEVLQGAQIAPFKQAVSMKELIASTTKAADYMVQGLDVLVRICEQLKIPELAEILVVFRKGFQIVFADLSPTEPQRFFENIDRYTSQTT